MTQSQQYFFVATLCFLAATVPTTAGAESSSYSNSSSSYSLSTSDDTSETLSLLQDLMKQVAVLQQRLAATRGEIRAELKDGLREGMTDEDIRKIQELLATDSAIYPEGITSGYFGPLTQQALERFQARHELPISGEIDQETKEIILEYFKERTNGQVPPGLLQSPGIDQKIKQRLENGGLNCQNQGGSALLCNFKDVFNGGANPDEVNDYIEDAKQIIKELEETIEGIPSEELAGNVEELLEKAKAYLEDAEAGFEGGLFDQASSLAKKAIRVAKDGLNNYNRHNDKRDDTKEKIQETKELIEWLESADFNHLSNSLESKYQDHVAKAKEFLEKADDNFNSVDYNTAYRYASVAYSWANKASQLLKE